MIRPSRKSPAFAIRDMRAGYLIELWLVAAVGAILVIRGFLAITGYPQVGGDSLHIAHMLWGGLLLTIALGMMLLFASSVWKPAAAIVGGIGFGTFIDELGKFITADNDYFYQPTIALIYLTFIGLFLVARAVGRRDTTTGTEHLFYAVEALERLTVGQLDEDGQREALLHLDASGDRSPFARGLREALTAAPVAPVEPSRLLRWRERGRAWYVRAVGNRWFGRGVLALFVFQAVLFLGTLATLIVTRNVTFGDSSSFVEWGTLLSTLVGATLVVIGAVQLARRARLSALRWFTHSVLVSIFFVQFFAFAAEEFAALGGLAVQLVLLTSLRLSISAEQTAQTEPAGVIQPLTSTS